MPTAAIGKKQIEKENNVTKPFEAKNATSKKGLSSSCLFYV